MSRLSGQARHIDCMAHHAGGRYESTGYQFMKFCLSNTPTLRTIGCCSNRSASWRLSDSNSGQERSGTTKAITTRTIAQYPALEQFGPSHTFTDTRPILLSQICKIHRQQQGQAKQIDHRTSISDANVSRQLRQT